MAAYIWPSYTGDEPRTRMFWPEGNGEWETVRKATAKFSGHTWPRRPVWGYCNEADPRVMEMQIDAAADHGVNVFIYDWYWYDGRPFLEQCLNNGYLKARNNDRVRFYLMWANHDVTHGWDKRIAHIEDNVIWRGAVDRQEFERIARRLIRKYFTHPSYYTIGSKPVFMIYDLSKLVAGLGGLDETADALAWFRAEAVAAGLPGLHLQLTSWGADNLNLSGFDADTIPAASEVIRQLGFDSQSHYQFVHFTNIDRDYADILPDVLKEWTLMEKAYDIPYFPHVSVGWDNNPRFETFRPGIVKNNTPAQFQHALELAQNYADRHPNQPPLITINSWNEWTETSYLQPDDLHGYGYLQAVREVFGHPAAATNPQAVSANELTVAGVESLDKVPTERPSVGAIRWDAWTGGEVTRQVEKTLGPLKYQARLPWFAQVNGDRDVHIDGGNQETMDQEIDFAACAGLDYWAFLLYPEGSSMSDSLRLYLDSAKRRHINFCLILGPFGVPDTQWPRERDRALALLREPGYQTVCGGRPLVYAFEMKYQGAFPEARFAEFRQAAKQESLDPYYVYMGWNPKTDFAMAAPWGFDAVSHYAYGSSDAEFSQLVRRIETDYWAAALAAQVPYIPLVTTGWDKHPRRDNPVSWERDHDYHEQTVFPGTATPDEIARHLGDACVFVRQHPTLCPANTVILYAWNEHDEGGWICPTWTPEGMPDSRRLSAIATILRGETPRAFRAAPNQ